MITNISNTYVFNPLEHGFEPITLYPELGFNFHMSENLFVKIVCYDNYGDLVYWYKIINTDIGFRPGDDDRIRIYSGSYDFRKPSEYGKQSNPEIEYIGLISNAEFAETLIKHLMGTTKNKSLFKESVERYNTKIGDAMRTEYPQHY